MKWTHPQPAFQQGIKSPKESLQAFSTHHWVGQEPWLLMALRPSPEWWGPGMELSEPWTSPSVLARVSPFQERSPCPHTWASSAGCPKVLFSFCELGHSFTRPTVTAWL